MKFGSITYMRVDDLEPGDGAVHAVKRSDESHDDSDERARTQREIDRSEQSIRDLQAEQDRLKQRLADLQQRKRELQKSGPLWG